MGCELPEEMHIKPIDKAAQEDGGDAHFDSFVQS